MKYSDIHFSYPARPNVSVLKGLDLSVTDGKTVALVGPSGCGKSTLIQLLERFYDPDRGEIKVDDSPLPYQDLSSTRSQLGIVSQEPNLFNRTIYENIAYGANDREVSMDEVIDVSKKANIYSFITSLPLVSEHQLKIINSTFAFLVFRGTIRKLVKEQRNFLEDKNNA